MPRPGPRPYDCVRKAWHSDRHQPMRGSLIQEIFRVANQAHSLATRKNKEWQEKLPIVVLKAEEIMYSKANSEAEYMDLKTLWDRANDAIDTIIRRDDTPESGDLLQPCIEAALHLGCIPRRASRSQRHNNPGLYLSSSTREAAPVSHEIPPDSSKAHLGSSAQLLPLPPHHPNNLSSPSSQSASWYLASQTPTTVNNSGCPSKAAALAHESSHEKKESLPYLSKDTLLSCQDGGPSVPMETCSWPNMGRVYPLYYNYKQPKMIFQPTLQSPQDPISNSYIATMPCVPFIGEVPTGLVQNFLHSNTTKDASNRSLTFVEASDDPFSAGCDLSLRLGLPSPPSLGAKSAWTHEAEDVGSSSSCNSRARAINDGSSSSSSKNKGFDFFHLDTTDEPLESCSSKGSSEGEGCFYVEASGRKRGVPVGGSFGNGYDCWKQKMARVPLLCRAEAPDF